MLMTFKFISPVSTSPLNFRLTYSTAYQIANKHLIGLTNTQVLAMVLLRYRSYLYHTIHPFTVYNSIDFSIFMEMLCRPLIPTSPPPKSLPLFLFALLSVFKPQIQESPLVPLFMSYSSSDPLASFDTLVFQTYHKSISFHFHHSHLSYANISSFQIYCSSLLISLPNSLSN